MNLLLLTEGDFVSPELVRIGDRRFRQLREVLHAEPGKRCKAGILGGSVGVAEVLRIDDTGAELRPELSSPPPPPSRVVLVAALQRPQTFTKVLHCAASMGVKELHFIASRKVEKSYWMSPVLGPEKVRETLILALEQAGDTILPQVEFHDRFKPFVEDVFPGLLAGRTAYVGHPAAQRPLPIGISTPVVLVVGPEGGFTDYEVEQLASRGAVPVSLGRRTLRTEFAVPALLATLEAGAATS